jgi:D-threo-aldose 1-dehydrogenase
MCARFGVPLAAAAIQFPLRHPAVTAVLVGARSATEMEEDAGLLEIAIPDELWAELLSALPRLVEGVDS